MNKGKQTIRDITLTSVLAAVLYVQQLALFFIPNVQFSTLLIMLYAKVFGFKRTTIIIIIHILAINIFSPFGPILPVHLASMFVGWFIIPLLLVTIFRKVESTIGLAFLGLLFGSAYGWAFIPATVFILDLPFLPYLIADIPFQIIMSVANFITILWLYDPLKKVLVDQQLKYFSNEKMAQETKYFF